MKCDKCGVEFTWKQSYDQLVSTCVGISKFQCKDCENVYSSKKNLRDHQKKNHKTKGVSNFLLINYYLFIIINFKCIVVKYVMKYNIYNFVVQSASVLSLHLEEEIVKK